jgi:hypothetical protein
MAVLREQGRRADLKIGHYISKPGAITRNGFGMVAVLQKRGKNLCWRTAWEGGPYIVKTGSHHLRRVPSRSFRASGMTEFMTVAKEEVG